MDARTTNPWLPRTVILAVILTLAGALVTSLMIGPGVAQGAAGSSFSTTTHAKINSAGIDVIWVSDTNEDGYVEFALSASDLSGETGTFSSSTDPRGALSGRSNKRTHRVSVVSQPAASTIHFNLISGSSVSGPHQVTLAQDALTTPGKLISGNVTFANGGSPAFQCVIRMRMTHNDSITINNVTIPTVEVSLWSNAITNGGSYVMDAKNIRQDPGNVINNDINTALNYDASSADSVFTLVAECDDQSTGTKTVTTADAAKDGSNNFINVNFTVSAPSGPDPTFSIAPSATSVAESAANVSLTVSLSPISASQLTVQVNTVAGTATAGSDYTTTSQTLTFAIGESTKTVTIPILQDTTDEVDETFQVGLSNQSAGSEISSTNSTSTVTIVDDDNAPIIEINKPADVLESTASSTISVELIGTSGANVTVNFTTSDGTATAGSDYTATNGTLTWTAGSTGIRTFTVAIIDDILPEDAETVILTLSGATTSVSTLGVTIASSTATLLILDDEPDAEIITILSDGEAMPGDGYFLIVAAANSDILDLVGTATAQLTSPMSQTLMPIANVSEVIRKMLGLDKLSGKAVTHAWFAVTSTSTGQQNIQFDVTLTYSNSATTTVSATLHKVTARTNRNFFIQDGVNFVGLGLVPTDTSITNLLTQSVNNSNPAFAALLNRQVTLADVIQSIFAFTFDNNASFESYNTADPITGADAADTFTQLAPFRGMVVVARNSVTPVNASSTDVFESVWVPGTGTTTVPVKINIVGPFLATVGNNPPLPAVQPLRTGFNLIAPHVWAPTPFDTAFGGTGGFDPGQVFSSAISFQRSVFPVSVSPSMVGAIVVQQFVTESPAIPPFVAPGTIDPVLSYWLRVAALPGASNATPPVITASGPNSGGSP